MTPAAITMDAQISLERGVVGHGFYENWKRMEGEVRDGNGVNIVLIYVIFNKKLKRNVSVAGFSPLGIKSGVV